VIPERVESMYERQMEDRRAAMLDVMCFMKDIASVRLLRDCCETEGRGKY
jgi:hypothetical protein